jgi:hypothetical protein
MAVKILWLWVAAFFLATKSDQRKLLCVLEKKANPARDCNEQQD